MRLVYIIVTVSCLSTGVLRCLCEQQFGEKAPQVTAVNGHGNRNGVQGQFDEESDPHSPIQPSHHQHPHQQPDNTLSSEEHAYSTVTSDASHTANQGHSQEEGKTRNNGENRDFGQAGQQSSHGQNAELPVVSRQHQQGSQTGEVPKTLVDEDQSKADEKLSGESVVSSPHDSSPPAKVSVDDGIQKDGEGTTTQPPSIDHQNFHSKHQPPKTLSAHSHTPPQAGSCAQDSKACGNEVPEAVLPSPTVGCESASANEQKCQERQPAQTELSKEEPSDSSKEHIEGILGELPIPSDKPHNIPVGSGGMVVEEPDLTEMTQQQSAEDEGEGVKKMTDDIQTFGEWRKKVLEEEQEKENEKVKQMALEASSKGEVESPIAINSQKLRVNYASEKCGAKIVSYNAEMENGNHMLTANRDEYMINPCSAKKWFVVELCEPISVKTVELASLELFSSQPRSYRLSLADRYPSKEWLAGGTFEMTAEKVPQPFTLSVKSPFVKFVRIEMLDHYGNEHFCPITLFRVFGLPMEDDDDDNVHHHTESEDEPGEGVSKTLFARTKETVVSLVKKVLYKDDQQQQQQKQGDETPVQKHANFSGDMDLPCDPDLENQRIEEKIAGTPVTVHHPQPTVQVAQEWSSSPVQGEIPMVTKLDDGEQQEIEDKKLGSGGQELVVLIQAVGWPGWQRALHYCHQPSRRLFSCPSRSRCLYVETLLGSPAPISFPRPPLARDPSVPAPESSRLSSSGLEPSFTSSAREMESVERVGAEGLAKSTQTEALVEPSSQLSQDATSSSSQATEQVPPRTTQHPASIISSATDQGAINREGREKTAVSQQTAVDKELSPSPLTPIQGAGLDDETKMVETDAGRVDSTARAGVDSDSVAAAGSSSVKLGQAVSSERVSADGSTEQLQPSVKPVPSWTQTRPTPVLQVEGSSISMKQDDRQQVSHTVHPSLSPSPTSELTLAHQDSAPYPHIIQPTMEEPKTAPTSEAAQPALPSSSINSDSVTAPVQEEKPWKVQNMTDTAVKKNDTEKKRSQLDLVTVPLSLSAKRESAVMRLTNRIKALELNVSLSSRFLEELSSRFKKQNEEMMKMMNKTMSKLNSTASGTQYQIAVQEERIGQLEVRLDNLTEAVQRLANRFDSFAEQISDRQMTFTTLNLILLAVSLVMCYRAVQAKPLHPDVQFLLDTMPRHPPPCSPFPRRNSEVTLSANHPGLPVAGAAIKKGGSLANLASTTTCSTAEGGDKLFLLDKPDFGPKKKKRKKSKTAKTDFVDADGVGRADSDPGLRAPCGEGRGGQCGRETGSETKGGGTRAKEKEEGQREEWQRGHRRWGSAGPSLTLAPTDDARPGQPDASRQVVFCVGDSVCPVSGADRGGSSDTTGSDVTATVVQPPPPHSVTSAHAVANINSLAAKPLPVPLQSSQQSKSTPSFAVPLAHTGAISSNGTDIGLQKAVAVGALADSDHSNRDHGVVSGGNCDGDVKTERQKAVTAHKVAALSRPATPTPTPTALCWAQPAVNGGQRGSGHAEPYHKGSFRCAVGGASDRGRGTGAKVAKKPGQGHVFWKT